jgi:hypothetical protein
MNTPENSELPEPQPLLLKPGGSSESSSSPSSPAAPPAVGEPSPVAVIQTSSQSAAPTPALPLPAAASANPTFKIQPGPGALSQVVNPPTINVGVLGAVEELSPEEYIALLTAEHLIGEEFKGSIDVGLALVEIRDRRLYRTEYPNFPAYYRIKWHFDQKKVHSLTATAEAHKAITTGANLPVPQSAFQLRPLSGLTPDQARLAWEHAVKMSGGRKITERLVRAAVLELKIKPEGATERMKHRQERGERRQQLRQTMTELLELIIMGKSYEELVQKASLLDQHVRFFFPKGRKQ